MPAACASAFRAVGCPVAASTASSDLSADALTRTLPSGGKRTARADSPCACTSACEISHAHPACRSSRRRLLPSHPNRVRIVTSGCDYTHATQAWEVCDASPVARSLIDLEAECRRRAACGDIASVRAHAAGYQRSGHQGLTGVQRAVLQSTVRHRWTWWPLQATAIQQQCSVGAASACTIALATQQPNICEEGGSHIASRRTMGCASCCTVTAAPSADLPAIVLATTRTGSHC